MISLKVMFLLYSFAMCVMRLVGCVIFSQRLHPVSGQLLEVVRCVMLVLDVSTKKYHYCTYINDNAISFVIQFCWLLFSMMQWFFFFHFFQSFFFVLMYF